MRRVFHAVLMLAMGCGAVQPGHAEDSPSLAPLRWVDDRGEALPSDETFELCWIRDLDRDCHSVAGHNLPRSAPGFDILTVESSGHGPLTLDDRTLEATEEGYTIRVPRKASLRVEELPEQAPVTLSLYSQESPEAPRPVLRRRLKRSQPVKIPADAFIVSLSQKGWAPQLTLLEARPGEQVIVEYRQHRGWSLLLKASHRLAEEPVSGVMVEVEPLPGYSAPQDPEEEPLTSETGAYGLVVYSGLRAPVVEASFEHPGFLPVRASALSATRGAFGYREVALPEGGSMEISVVLDGRAVPGAGCALAKSRRDAPGSQAMAEVVFRGTTDERGHCRTSNLREGRYWLRVRPPRRLVEAREAESARVDRAVQILEGQVTGEEVVLEPTELEGTVHRGQEPAPDYEVLVLDPRNQARNATSRDALITTRTDEDGRYEVTVWASGEHTLFVQNPSGVPGASKTLRLDGGTETVDFHLAPREITGGVVDANGKPLEGASVRMQWNESSHRLAVTGPDGGFSFPVEEEGRAELTAQKQGYRPAEPRSLDLASSPPLQPVVLTLTRWPQLQGRLSAAGGAPVSGGWVAAYRLELQEPSFVAMTETGPEGGFELPVASGSAHRLFFSGPHCPLGARSIASSTERATPLEIRCAEAPAHLQLTLETPDGVPREGASLLFARGRVIYPHRVLATHLTRLGVPAATDGSGRLALVALEPGTYRLYLAGATSPFNILVDAPQGFLAQARLAPWATRTAQIAFEVGTPNALKRRKP